MNGSIVVWGTNCKWCGDYVLAHTGNEIDGDREGCRVAVSVEK